MNVKEIEEDQDWYFQRGLVKNKIDVQKMADLRFIQAVVQTLGPYGR